MKKNYLYLILLFLSNLLVVGQTVTLTSISVNGATVNTSPINLGSVNTSTVLLSVKVALKTVPSDNSPGTINIYQQKSASSPAINPTGGNGGNLLFLGSTSAERSFNISLEYSNFDPSGGVLYAEYKTYSGTIHKSSPISVIRQSSGTGGGMPANAPNPSNIANTICCNQTVRLGDKPALITGSQYANPYENYGYGINSSWSSNSSTPFDIDKINKTLNFDYTTELKNITVTRSLGYNSSTNLPNKSNAITITVVPSPILNNKIYTDEPVNSNGFIELSNVKELNIYGNRSTTVNLKILENPFYVSQPRDPGASIDSYKWEYTTTNTNLSGFRTWNTLINENSSSLNFENPSEKSNLEDTYYLIRRIAIYKNITNASEPIKVLIRGLRNNNTICCDQTLKITSLNDIESPNTIIGSTPIYSNPNLDPNNSYYSIAYQWQNQIINRGISAWTDIINATSKDYLPLPLKVVESGRGSLTVESTYNYRRIAKIIYTGFINGVWSTASESCYSNEMNLSAYTTDPIIVKIYPNPTSSVLNIEDPNGNFIGGKISIIDISGNIVIPNSYSIVSSSLITMDVSNLLTGTYFIKIDTDPANRKYARQFAFIKQ